MDVEDRVEKGRKEVRRKGMERGKIDGGLLGGLLHCVLYQLKLFFFFFALYVVR